MILGVLMSSQDSLWEFHVDVHLDRSLRIGYNKVNLAESRSEKNSECDHEPDGKPCHNMQHVRTSQNSSFRRLDFRRGGSTWPCET